jgi:hypothetical protein
MNDPQKGFECMMQITSGNNQRLSDMADNKAQILITVTSILLSVIISLVLKRLDTDTYLLLPTFLLSSVCLATMIYAILATRPVIPKAVYHTGHDIELHKCNLLFFGNFYKMKVEDYTESMLKVMGNTGHTYRMLIRDVFYQGKVLARKYRRLHIAYNIFMYGLILSVAAYFLASLLSPSVAPHSGR